MTTNIRDVDGQSGARLPHPEAVQGGQHSGRLLRRQVMMTWNGQTMFLVNSSEPSILTSLIGRWKTSSSF